MSLQSKAIYCIASACNTVGFTAMSITTVVLVLVFVVILTGLALLVLFYTGFSTMEREQAKTRREIALVLDELKKSEAVLPEIDGWIPQDVLKALRLAANVEFSEHYETGRPPSFSRRFVRDSAGWKESYYNEFITAMETQGYLEQRGARKSVKWTSKGLLLLTQVKSGRFSHIKGGDLYTVDAP